MTDLKHDDLLSTEEGNKKPFKENFLSFKRPASWIIVVALISVFIIVACFIYYNQNSADTISRNEDVKVSSITLQPLNEIIEATGKVNVGYLEGSSPTPDFDNLTDMVYSFGDGSKVSLTYTPEGNPSMNSRKFCDEQKNIYHFETDGNVGILFKSKMATNILLSIKELEKLSKVYLNKFIGENDYQIVNNGKEPIENAKEQTFIWTKYINNIPTKIQEVTIKLAQDGSIISSNNIGIVQKNDYINSLGDMINSLSKHITEERAIEIAKAKCNKDNINIENATIITKLYFAHASRSPILMVENKYQLQWFVLFKDLSYIETYGITINATTGEIIFG